MDDQAAQVVDGGDVSPDVAAAMEASLVLAPQKEETAAESSTPARASMGVASPWANAARDSSGDAEEDAPLVYDNSVQKFDESRSPSSEHEMVGYFVDAVTAQYDKAALGNLIAEAKESGISDVVNVICYRDKKEGRTPLAYAVAKNFERVVRDLIDLGANVELVR